MDRREFFAKIGTGAAVALVTTCLGSCSNSNTPSGPVDFSIDLSSTQFSSLQTKGNYVVTNQCVVAHGTDGKYYAATVMCSHEGELQVTYNKNTNEYYCTAHGARYNLSGSGLNSNGSRGLTIYTTELSGTTLRVHS